MEKYICENVFVPLRAGPSHIAEMLSQVLFGEKYISLARSGNWMKIETSDKYSGWIDTDHIQNSPDEDDLPPHVLNRELVCYKEDKTKLILEAGCDIYKPDVMAKTFTLGKYVYNTGDEFSNDYFKIKGSYPDTALRFINSPYIWGGRIPSAIDCSGYTKLIYKIHGITIPHDSRMQADLGKEVELIENALPGDLVFFDEGRGRITHVGMIFSKGFVIHASGRVRIDMIDQTGIFKKEKKDYSHPLVKIKRLISLS